MKRNANEVLQMFTNVIFSLIAQTVVSVVSIIFFVAYENSGAKMGHSADTVVYIVLTGFSLLLLFLSGMLLKNLRRRINNLISVSVVSIVLIIAWVLKNNDGSYIVLNLPFLPLFYVLSNNRIAGLVFAFIPSLILWIGIEHKNKNNS